jgi:aminopeptidase-like protein
MIVAVGSISHEEGDKKILPTTNPCRPSQVNTDNSGTAVVLNNQLWNGC